MAQCPRCKGDMPLLSKICPSCGYTIDNSETTLTPMEYMESLESLLKDFRLIKVPSFFDSLKKFLTIVMLLLTIYFFVMSFMTGGFIFKLFCNISLVTLVVSLIILIVKRLKNKSTVTAEELKSEFEYLIRSARQEFGKNPEMSRFLDNVTKEMLAVDDEHTDKRRSVVRTWIIVLIVFAAIFAGSTTITSILNKKALEVARYGLFQPRIEEFVVSEANSEFLGEVERLALVVDMLSSGDIEHAQMFVKEFCLQRSGDYDCAEAIVTYLVGIDSVNVAQSFIDKLNLRYDSDKKKLEDLLKVVEL